MSVSARDELQDDKRSPIANDELFFYHAVLEQWAHRLAQCVFVCATSKIKAIGKHGGAQRWRQWASARANRDRAIPKPNQMSVNPVHISHLNDYNDRRQVISPLLSMGIVKINIYVKWLDCYENLLALNFERSAMFHWIVRRSGWRRTERVKRAIAESGRERTFDLSEPYSNQVHCFFQLARRTVFHSPLCASVFLSFLSLPLSLAPAKAISHCVCVLYIYYQQNNSLRDNALGNNYIFSSYIRWKSFLKQN